VHLQLKRLQAGSAAEQHRHQRPAQLAEIAACVAAQQADGEPSDQARPLSKPGLHPAKGPARARAWAGYEAAGASAAELTVLDIWPEVACQYAHLRTNMGSIDTAV
jgi:hypothetical protein